MDAIPTPPPTPAGLSDFIHAQLATILERWEQFARSIPSAHGMNDSALRDHAAGLLAAIADDLKHPQTSFEQEQKSKGRAPRSATVTQAALHGADRGARGFSINETVSEFRALRASVLHLWSEANGSTAPGALEQMVRFNEAIDQALAESMERYATDKEETTRRFDMLLSSSPDLQYIVGVDGSLIYGNKAFLLLCEPSAQPLTGENIARICPAIGPQIARDLPQVIATRAPCSGEISYTHASGTAFAYRYVLMPVLNDSGQVESITGTARNIAELNASREEIQRNAYYDSLTELPNRRLFHDRLEHDVRHAARTGNALALLFIDLDFFKEVNDRSGHAAGDMLLQESARRITACVRATDTVARIGGDEFTVILTEVNKVSHVDIMAQKVLDALARPFRIGEKEVHVSGSVGITLYPQDASTPGDLVRNADQAMYVAKQTGRNRFSFFTVEMRDSAWVRLQIIDELRHALAKQQLEVFYQPIVNLATETIVKAEALVRWHHPRRGLVAPGEFIGLAEETGLIDDIGNWVLGEAAARAREWSALTGAPFQISVNKSPAEFMSRTTVKAWDAELVLLRQAGRQIAVEITEGMLLNDTPGILKRLDELALTGAQLSIDDFGIGYSSMSYLKKFKVDFIKIDQSFVKDITTNLHSSVFAETILLMAHKLGLKVIAEGIETTEQRDFLKTKGCDYAQGFLFSAPVPSASFEHLLAREANPARG
jgi:diguanylate cyclase (GGDEF)-like protein/PAS domain S-box-containing protein